MRPHPPAAPPADPSTTPPGPPRPTPSVARLRRRIRSSGLGHAGPLDGMCARRERRTATAHLRRIASARRGRSPHGMPRRRSPDAHRSRRREHAPAARSHSRARRRPTRLPAPPEKPPRTRIPPSSGPRTNRRPMPRLRLPEAILREHPRRAIRRRSPPPPHDGPIPHPGPRRRGHPVANTRSPRGSLPHPGRPREPGL